MGIINKLSIQCGVNAPTEFIINLIDTDDAGINAILATIPVGLGAYSYAHSGAGTNVSSHLTTVESAGCEATLFKDSVGYNSKSTCCVSENPVDLLSGDLGNVLTIGADGGIYYGGIISDCCIIVNKVPLAVVIDPNVVQTTNLNSIVTDSAGNVFFIDGAGNAKKITTNFSLTVNAGTTNVVTDASLGTATVGNGGIIHFWSSDGSVLFGVVQGSAETNVQTNSTIIPFTASVPAGNDAGIVSTTVQGAIDEVDGKIEVLEDVNRPWNKTGDLQATNAESVLTTDDILHEGKTNTGASEALMPFHLQYIEQTGNDGLSKANRRLYGFDVVTDSFKTNITNDYNVAEYPVYVDIVGGTDELDITAYLGATEASSGTPTNGKLPAFGYKFKTLEACCTWVNQFDKEYIVIYLQNTTALAPCIVGTTINFMNKHDVDIRPNPSTTRAYLTLNRGIRFYNCKYVGLSKLDIFINRQVALYALDKSRIYLNFITINVAPTIINPLGVSDGSFAIIYDFTFNFSANNQRIFSCPGNYIGYCDISDHATNFTINSGAFTGLSWCESIKSFYTYFPQSVDGGLPLNPIPSSVNMDGSISFYSSRQTLRQKIYDSLSYNYAQNLGTAKPLRFTDLNSASPDSAVSGDKYLKINALGEIVISTT
jgi:hypothetical protein